MKNELHKNDDPLVSICIQTYQQRSYISQALDSVLAQEINFPIEILLGEDESTDGTREICIHYANKYPDIINLSLNNRKNALYIDGFPTARWNFLNNLNRARGQYIALLPGDDYWTGKNKLSRQVAFLENNPDFILSCHNTQILYEDNPSRIAYFRPDWCQQTKDVLTIEDQIKDIYGYHTSSVIFRNGQLEIPEFFNKIVSGDIALFTLLSQHGKIKYFEDAMSVWRKTPAGISNTHVGKRLCLTRLNMNTLLNDYFDNKYRDLYSVINEELYRKLFNELAEKRDLREFFQYLYRYVFRKESSSKGKGQRLFVALKATILMILFLMPVGLVHSIRKMRDKGEVNNDRNEP